MRVSAQWVSPGNALCERPKKNYLNRSEIKRFRERIFYGAYGEIKTLLIFKAFKEIEGIRDDNFILEGNLARLPSWLPCPIVCRLPYVMWNLMC